MFGGVLEHPCDSHAWEAFHMIRPKRHKGWCEVDLYGGRSCYVEQGHYGHLARKGTWLYAVLPSYPELNWSRGEQRLHPVALERYGYEKARRMGQISMVGGKDKTKVRNATPIEFRNLLLNMVGWS